MSGAQLAEAQARLNVALKDIVQFFEDEGVKEHSVVLLNSFIDKHLTVDFLALAENFGKCMAFINHDELTSRLFKSFSILMEGYIIERKVTNKRLKMLKEDKKSDPDVILRLENLIIDIDQRKAVVTVSVIIIIDVEFVATVHFVTVIIIIFIIISIIIITTIIV